MGISTVGINYKIAPIAWRDQVALPPEKLRAALQGLKSVPGITEAAIVSTCNRTEVYTNRVDPNVVLAWWRDFCQCPEIGRQIPCYAYNGADAVRHTLRVAAGLDSMVLGEHEILGQLKTAFHQATQEGAVKKLLNRLFQHAFGVAKRVRTQTNIGAHPISVAFAAVHLAKHIYPNLAQTQVLLVGAGKMSALLAQHLQRQGVQRWIFANRNMEKAQYLAERYSGQAVPLSGLEYAMAQADIVICATHSPHYLVTRAMVERSAHHRQQATRMMIDLSVPRNIEPSVADHSSIFLYTVDDLDETVAHNRRLRAAAAEEGERLIDVEVSEYMRWLQAQSGMTLIRS
ncbi:MAG: glutamyl-tRNA reductase, partial [Pseudomonadota bacterium]